MTGARDWRGVRSKLSFDGALTPSAVEEKATQILLFLLF